MPRGIDGWWPRRRRRFEGLARYLSAAGIAVTVAITLVLALSIGNGHKDLKLELDFSIALIGVAIVLGLESLVRVSERARRREEYANLLDYLEDYPTLLPILTRLSATTAKTMTQTQVPEFKIYARRELIRTQLTMASLAEGRWLAAPGDNSLMFAHYETVEHSVRAVTDDRDTEWWLSVTGTNYLRLNHGATKRHVTVERVFLLETSPTDDTLTALDRNRDHGVNLWVARSDRVDPDLRINITLFDETLMHQDIVNRGGRTVQYMYSENESDLDRAGSLFLRLRSRAVPYLDHSSAEKLFT